jgi:hypothetical protein
MAIRRLYIAPPESEQSIGQQVHAQTSLIQADRVSVQSLSGEYAHIVREHHTFVDHLLLGPDFVEPLHSAPHRSVACKLGKKCCVR